MGSNREKRKRASEAALAIAMAMQGGGFAMSPQQLQPLAAQCAATPEPTAAESQVNCRTVARATG